MFNAEIRDLESLKKTITEIKSSTDSGSSSTSKPVIINSPELQLTLDLLTNIPLSVPMTTNEMYQFQNYGPWAQSLGENTHYKVMPMVSDMEYDSSAVYDIDFRTKKYKYLRYLDVLEKDCIGNINYQPSANDGGGGYSQ